MRRSMDIEIAMAERPKGMSLQRWLYNEIRSAILTGRLLPGSRLPSTRELASRLKLSRGTILIVYELLGAEGYIQSKTGRGSFVAPELPDFGSMAAAGEADRLKFKKEFEKGYKHNTFDVTLSAIGKRMSFTPFPVEGRAQPARAFRHNQPDVSMFPFDLWTRITTARSRRLSQNMLSDCEARGYRPLREAIADHLRSTRGINCNASHVILTGSTQQLIDISARLLLEPGDEIWIEDPGYIGARLLFAAAGVKIRDIPVDDRGMDVHAACKLAPNARLAYVTAGNQAPLGSVLALDRRFALLDWSRQQGSIVIEDDYNSEHRFSGAPLAALKSLDNSDHVIYCGTFSKLLFPALRMAYAVLPDQLVDPFTAALSLTYRHAPLIPQITLHEFIAEGHFGRHIRRMRLRYAERAGVLKQAADIYLTGLLEIPEIAMGLETPAYLPSESDDKLAVRLAAQAGIESSPLSSYAHTHFVRPGMLLGFAAISPDEIISGVQTLARVLG